MIQKVSVTSGTLLAVNPFAFCGYRACHFTSAGRAKIRAQNRARGRLARG